MRPPTICLPIAAALLLAAAPAWAAESYDNCTGFIDAVPAVIASQGTWCLRHDLSTAMASGNAITVAANNVTIDCNDFKLGGLAAGSGSLARGIDATDRHNVGVRNCNIRGFNVGIAAPGVGSGHRIEDNRLDNNLVGGIVVEGENNLVRGNQVLDTGGFTGGAGNVAGIHAAADILDNTVAGVFSDSDAYVVVGILAGAPGVEVRGNRVRGLDAFLSYGLFTTTSGVTVDANRVSAVSATNGTGIYGAGVLTFCSNNTVVNFDSAYTGCEAAVDNLTLPAP